MFHAPVARYDLYGATSTQITIFIVEDCKLARMGLYAFFKNHNAIRIIGEAGSAESALIAVRQLRPNIVLMDLELPGMNGIQAAHQIKVFDPSIKVVMLTSHDTEADVAASLEAGIEGYCLKDITPEHLAEVIKTVAEGGTWIEPSLVARGYDIYLQAKQPGLYQAKLGNKFNLTEREREVLQLVVEGKSNNQIADELVVSVHTAKAHVCNILQKLLVTDRVQAAVKAIREGLV